MSGPALARAVVRAEPPREVPAPFVYAHVPFCAKKCPYCDFNSHAGRDAESDAYVDALLEEARRRAPGSRPRTLFVGGGTPTHLGTPLLERLLEGLVTILGAERLEEVTVEANPGSLDLAKVRALRRAGVTRVSVGAQSFDDRHLRTLGRLHDAADAVRALDILREGGIGRLSLDLILAVPGQTAAEQERDLLRAVDLSPEHVSAYVLTYEEGTAFTRWMQEGRLPPPEEEREALHLEIAGRVLAEAGYARYEVSNHARPGAACLHNLAYWRNEDWLGLGAGAHAHVGGRRWKNVDDPASYVTRIRARGEAVGWAEALPATVALFESLMMGLRLSEGVDCARIAARTGLDPRQVHARVLEGHVAAGLLVLDGDRIRPTPRGMDLASYVARAFLPDPE